MTVQEEMKQLKCIITKELYNAELANKMLCDIEKKIEQGDIDVIWVGTINE